MRQQNYGTIVTDTRVKMSLRRLALLLLSGAVVLTSGCATLNEAEDSHTCTATVSLSEEISSELSDLETAQSEIETIATDIEDLLEELSSRDKDTLEALHGQLSDIAASLATLHTELESKELEAECD